MRNAPTHRAADAPVVVGACHDLTDVAMVALVEDAGYRAC
ncbi:LuxR family transcriptional regulator, partial [Gordonia sp. i37]